MSNSTTIPWKSDPDFRGTFNILSTCLGTLFICVWSAVHDDIPKGEKGFGATLRRVGWLVVGLLAPELLLYVSFYQWWEAGYILRPAEEAFGQRTPSSSSWSWRSMDPRKWTWTKLRTFLCRHARIFFRRTGPEVPLGDQADTDLELALRSPSATFHSTSSVASSSASESSETQYQRRHPWTLTHAFWANMGGFKISGEYEGERYLPAWQGDALLTPQGVRFLLNHAPHLIPDISAKEIMDRSKADGLAKALLVWQVLWFCINCGSRLAQRLPLSLLEVTTIAHGASTLITYCFWWKKPFNVSEPIVIECKTEEAASLGAFMSVTSGGGRNILCGLKCFRALPESSALACIPLDELLGSMDEGERR